MAGLVVTHISFDLSLVESHRSPPSDQLLSSEEWRRLRAGREGCHQCPALGLRVPAHLSPPRAPNRARGQLLPPRRSPDSMGTEHRAHPQDSVFTSNLAGPLLWNSVPVQTGNTEAPPRPHAALVSQGSLCSPALPQLSSCLPSPCPPPAPPSPLCHYSPCSLSSPLGLRALPSTLPTLTLLSLFLLLSPSAHLLLSLLSSYSPSLPALSLHSSSSPFSPHSLTVHPVLSALPLLSLLSVCLFSLLLP